MRLQLSSICTTKVLFRYIKKNNNNKSWYLQGYSWAASSVLRRTVFVERQEVSLSCRHWAQAVNHCAACPWLVRSSCFAMQYLLCGVRAKKCPLPRAARICSCFRSPHLWLEAQLLFWRESAVSCVRMGAVPPARSRMPGAGPEPLPPGWAVWCHVSKKEFVKSFGQLGWAVSHPKGWLCLLIQLLLVSAPAHLMPHARLMLSAIWCTCLV